MSLKRFIARKEYFGCLVYDRDRKDYISFDDDAAVVFRESIAGTSLDEIRTKFCQTYSDQSFATFVALCKSIDLLDEHDRFNGDFISKEILNNGSFLSFPIKLHLQITNECPLRCRHCSQSSYDRLENELSLAEIKRIIDEMADYACQELTIGGGEPFVSELLLDTIKYASEKGLSVSISTSGMCVTRALAKRIADLGLKSIRISFDGPSEKSYDYLRGKGTYRRAVRGIKTLRELFKIPIRLHSVIMKPNLGELLGLFRAVQKLEADEWSVDFMMIKGAARTVPHFAITKEDAALVSRSIERFSHDSELKITMPTFPYKGPKNRIYRGFGCPGGNTSIYISANGAVRICGFMPEGVLGNIRTKSIAEIWHQYQQHKLSVDSSNDTCRICDFFESCRGGCRARAKLVNKPNEPDPNCFLNVVD